MFLSISLKFEGTSSFCFRAKNKKRSNKYFRLKLSKICDILLYKYITNSGAVSIHCHQRTRIFLSFLHVDISFLL
jgi:hypothetical protein